MKLFLLALLIPFSALGYEVTDPISEPVSTFVCNPPTERQSVQICVSVADDGSCAVEKTYIEPFDPATELSHYNLYISSTPGVTADDYQAAFEGTACEIAWNNVAREGTSTYFTIKAVDVAGLESNFMTEQVHTVAPMEDQPPGKPSAVQTVPGGDWDTAR